MHTEFSFGEEKLSSGKETMFAVWWVLAMSLSALLKPQTLQN